GVLQRLFFRQLGGEALDRALVRMLQLAATHLHDVVGERVHVAFDAVFEHHDVVAGVFVFGLEELWLFGTASENRESNENRQESEQNPLHSVDPFRNMCGPGQSGCCAKLRAGSKLKACKYLCFKWFWRGSTSGPLTRGRWVSL